MVGASLSRKDRIDEYPANTRNLRALAPSLSYYGAQNDYTHIFILWELISQMHRTSVTQGLLADFFCVIGRLHKVFSVNVPITHINCL